VLVRRRIQTPSVASVLSVVQPEGEVVLGASPPARHFMVGRSARGPRAFDLLIAATALAAGLPPYTRNPGDFEGVSRLEVVTV
jgi:hypothetical protein